MTGATQTSLAFLLQHLQVPDHVSLDWNPHTLIQTRSAVRILWAHYLADQPLWRDVELGRFTHVVCPSEYARQQWLQHFRHSTPPVSVIRNGGAPWFRPGIKQHKRFIYISTPFRGLALIPELWPQIYAVHPDAVLDVFSGMALYGQSEEPYLDLYQRLLQMPGVRYHAPVPHRDLVPYLQAADIFFYPNIWPESSCVSLIEALRCGCRPVISDLGALPETAGGQARIVPFQGDVRDGYKPNQGFMDEFVRATLDTLARPDWDINGISQWACQHYDWAVIAEAWRRLLSRFARPSIQWY